jgi:hypothetical protein
MRIIGGLKGGHGFRRHNCAVLLVVSANEDKLGVRDFELNGTNRSRASPLQFAEPLECRLKIRDDRHTKNAPAIFHPAGSNPVAQYRF